MISALSLSRRGCLALGAASLVSRPVSAATARPVIVELFTSQGCSSCPPADAFMQDLVKRKDVVALSYSVDYWDYLGWKDTLGSSYNSKRQYDYAKSRGDMDVYTPQMIVDGGAHFVGSNRGAVNAAIAEAANAARPDWIAMEIKADGGEIVVDVPGASGAADGTVWLMSASPSVSVKIERGENAGSDIAYHNSVRKCEAVGMWKGEAASIRVPKNAVARKGATTIVALLQAGHVGPILGAARLDSPAG
jgi:hypothetical protein